MSRFDGGYIKIEEATKVEDRLIVKFKNGDMVSVPLVVIAPHAKGNLHWDSLRIEVGGLIIVVPGAPTYLEMTSDRIRSLTDPAFASHMHELAVAQLRHVGGRIRQLREERNMTHEEVAARAGTGIRARTVQQVETGDLEFLYLYNDAWRAVWEILRAMGCSMGDLATPHKAS